VKQLYAFEPGGVAGSRRLRFTWPGGCAVRHAASFAVGLVTDAAGDALDLLDRFVAAFGAGMGDAQFSIVVARPDFRRRNRIPASVRVHQRIERRDQPRIRNRDRLATRPGPARPALSQLRRPVQFRDGQGHRRPRDRLIAVLSAVRLVLPPRPD